MARLEALCRRSPRRIARTLCTALTLSIALIGCGDQPPKPPPGPLAAALGDIAGGGEHGSLGVGWTDPPLAREGGAGARLMAAALGPNAESVIEAAPELRRRFGFDPLSARRLLSVGGSYAFGLRLEGVDGAGLRDALTRAGGSVRESGEVQLEDAGDYAEVPEPLLRSGVLGLGARDAFSGSLTVLAISELDRDRLLGRGDRLIDQPIYRAAADCLGDVFAARMIPDKLLLSTELGVDLVAVGIAREREVLCVLGGTPQRARAIAAALRASLAPDAREPRTGESMSRLVRAVEVRTSSYEDVEVVRAELRPAGARPSGFLFGAIARGSLVQLINGS
jgi:hypothetical protein